ncbi:Mo25-domain-containing protein [Melanomma pulvis-pyrius CBS 109.77]|uniref:Mo25-domain-containing protein n=1 Tax=Melanomma pulvis-pyrius CBS 109.77 TaxID=1314802 RepID=A0A6A6XH09_9PLEO|nr:Mo25-domain-containing protein [Melanomma pulvis-pyrius CBS 109.77]
MCTRASSGGAGAPGRSCLGRTLQLHVTSFGSSPRTTAIRTSALSVTAAEDRREATIFETQIYDAAKSLEDYEKICEEKIAAIAQQIGQPAIVEEDKEPVPSLAGMSIGRYKNAVYHQEGLFSVVYKAAALESEPKGGLVALKVTTPSSMEPPHDSKREARALELSASDHVIPLLETFREAGTRFVLVFPFIPFDLHHMLQDQRLSKAQARACLKDMFSALGFIHSKGIIHRDVKPSNILLKSPDGPAYLSDFGIAWAPNDPGSEAPDSKVTDVGTTCYRPPELLFGNTQYGCTLDLWAAGCTVAETVVPNHPTLFDSGELGSDLALIQSIFKKLGTPDLTVWPEAASLRDWGKMQFHEYPPQPWPSLLPKASKVECDLVGELVRYESGARMTAAQLHAHSCTSLARPPFHRYPTSPPRLPTRNMAFLFRNKQKNNVELAKSTKDLTLRLSEEPKPNPKLEEELARNLQQMKITLQGTPDAEVTQESMYQLLTLIVQEDLLYLLANNIHKLPFESRKDAQVIFSTAFRYKPTGASDPQVLHHVIQFRPEIIIALCRGYDRRESAMPCGGVLREALKYDAIAALLLYDEPTPDGKTRDLASVNPDLPSTGEGVFWRFFDWIDKGAFEVSADAFNTFRDILTKHKSLVAAYLQTNFEIFFSKYNQILIQSESYVTKRQSIKLLGEILLDRANYSVMTTYVDSGEHLKIIMKLLRDDRRMINYEGFHVFKVFVANPNKSIAVQRILISNREKLLRFLPSFLEDRTEDDQFIDEKSFLIRQIEQLPPAPVPPPAS